MAKKPTYSSVTDRDQNASEINAALDAVNEGFSNTLSLDGSTPNAMNSDLDMNSNDVLNAKDLYTQRVYIGGSLLAAEAAQLVDLAVKKEYTTVANMLADTTDYDFFITDDYIRVLDGDHTYKVAETGVGDNHLVNAGGVKLYVLPGASGYDVEAFGFAASDDVSGIFVALSAGEKISLGNQTWKIKTNAAINHEVYNGTLELDGGRFVPVGAFTLGCKVTLSNAHRGDWITATSISGINITSQFELDGNASGIGVLSVDTDQSWGRFTGCSNMNVIGARFHDSSATPLFIRDSSDFDISGCKFENLLGLVAFGGTGVETSAGIYTQRCNDFTITGNRGSMIDDNAIALIGAQRATVTGNQFKDVRLLVIIHDDGGQTTEEVVVSENTATGCDGGITLGWWDGAIGYPCQDLTLANNRTTSETGSSTLWTKNYGIRVRYSTTDCKISGNNIGARLGAFLANTTLDPNLPVGGFSENDIDGNSFVSGEGGLNNSVIADASAGDANRWKGNYFESLQYISGSIQTLFLGTDDEFKGNTVKAPASYNEAIFKAGSVVRGNTFDTVGALASSNTYELVGNDFINGADINEAGTAVKISGNRGSTNNQVLYTNRIIREGSGSPEGVIAAVVGSIWMRRDGGAGTSMYVKESGTGNTGWVAK